MPTIKGFKFKKGMNVIEELQKKGVSFGLPFEAEGWESEKNEHIVPNEQRKHPSVCPANCKCLEVIEDVEEVPLTKPVIVVEPKKELIKSVSIKEDAKFVKSIESLQKKDSSLLPEEIKPIAKAKKSKKKFLGVF